MICDFWGAASVRVALCNPDIESELELELDVFVGWFLIPTRRGVGGHMFVIETGYAECVHAVLTDTT